MSNTALLGSYASQAGTALTFKNRLINGDMKISQRFGTGNAAITAGTVNYITDRWVVFCSTAGATCSQVSATIAGHTKALRVLPAAGNTYTEIVQRVEAVNIEDLASSVVTFSGWVYIDNATGVTANVVAYVAAGVDSYSPTAPTAITITNPGITLSSGSYVYVEKQITLPANATNGIQVGVSFTGVASKDVRLTGASLEAGPTATPFERRPYSVELGMAQRYYWRWTATSDTTITYASIAGAGLNSASAGISLPVPMRVNPGITHNFLNANFVTANPTGAQWGVLISGVAFINKTGTAAFSIIPVTNTALNLRVLSADFASAPNALAVGPSIFVDANAEL